MGKQRVAFVTGGSRGIGRAIVERLVKDGCRVAFTYLENHAAAAQVQGATGIQADSADPAALDRAIRQAAAASGSIDILVHNAGIQRAGLVGKYPLDDFDHMVAVNVRAILAGTQSALPFMGQGGRIITIGSASGDVAAFPQNSIYAMTKSAVQGLVRGMAIDLAPRGITVNNIQPGVIATEMNPSTGKMADAITAMVPLRRLGLPSEVASLVAWLASEEAGYTTGASLTMDGGFTA
jgi:3-oxoacyl-[acyl-carrier protein] reductase